MRPQPDSNGAHYRAAARLADRTVLISGGDSGIGRAIAVLAAKEGARIAFAYLNEEEDAAETMEIVRGLNRPCVSLAGDIGDERFCKQFVDKATSEFGEIHALVNNAGEQHPQERLESISAEQLERTFRTNVFSQFFLTKAALPRMKSGSAIVNVASITAYEGSPKLIDYSSTKGAIVSFTRALSNSVIERGIRVNAVAPGPIWTPLIPATFSADEVEAFGRDTPMKRHGEPYEVATAVIFLLSDDSSYISGQTMHVNGGTIVNG